MKLFLVIIIGLSVWCGNLTCNFKSQHIIRKYSLGQSDTRPRKALQLYGAISRPTAILRPLAYHLAFVYTPPAFWANEAAYYEQEKHPKRSHEENFRRGLEQFKVRVWDIRIKDEIEGSV